MNIDPQQAETIIHQRRAIFTPQFSGEKVSDDIINKMLESANMAPTHGMTEPWRFTVFKEDGLKKLGNFQAELYEKLTPEQDQDDKKKEKLRKKPLECSHVISIGMKRQETEKIPEMEELAAVACAVQNMWLIASSYGIGCYWSTGGVTYWEEAKDFFDLGPKDRLMGFLYLGMPSIEWPTGKRRPIEEKVKWVSDK